MGTDLKGKELGTGICQRKDGKYHARYVDRFGNRKSLYDWDLRVLRKKLSEAIYVNEKQLNPVDDKTTLDDWYKCWFSTYKMGFVRPNTLVIYSGLYNNHIKDRLGNMHLTKITKIHCTNLLKDCNVLDHLQWSVLKKIKILMTDMFNRAIEDNYLVRNPMRMVRLPINKPDDEVRVLTQEEQNAFFECCAGTFYDNLFIVAVNTGLRIGELAALTWEDIDIENKIIHVDKTLTYQKYLDEDCKTFHIEDPKTYSSKRDVPINDACLRALKKQYIQKQIIQNRNIKQSEFSDRFFTTKYNTPLNTQIVSDAISKIVKELNLVRDKLDELDDFSCHTFRHTFATRCIESGINAKIVQAYLGHATLQMTMDLYVHVTDDTKQTEIEKLNDINDKIISDDTFLDKAFNKTLEENQKVIVFDASKLA